MDLSGASILVAGASGGLGSAISSELDRRGALLTVVGRDEGRLRRAPGRPVVADLRLPEESERVVTEVIAAHGRLDGVVNATGVVAFGPVEDTEPDTIEELALTNTFLPMFLFRAALPHLTEGGTLVNLSGVVAEQPIAGMAAYSASKAAISAWLTAVRREVRRRGIVVIDARPGHTETGLAGRPIAGNAPRFPTGHDPETVARRVVEAMEAGEADLPQEAF